MKKLLIEMRTNCIYLAVLFVLNKCKFYINVKYYFSELKLP